MHLPVKLQFDDSVDVVDGVCNNVSIGGMLISVDSPRSQGSLVRFELDLEDAVSIRGLGEVIWMRVQDVGSDEPSMGVKFRFLEQRDRQLILKLVSQHIKERLEKRHPGEETPAVPPPAVPPEAPDPDPAKPAVDWMTTPREDEPTMPLEPPLSPPRAAEMPPAWESPLVGADELALRSDAGGEPESAFDEPRYEPARPSRRRPTQRRDFPLLPVAALLLVVAVVVAFFYRDELFGPPAPEPSATTDPADGDPATGDPADGEPADGEPADGEGPEDLTEPPSLSVEPVAPPQAVPPPPRAAPPPPQALAPFTRVVNISWSRRPGGVKIEIETNGAVAPERYSHFRLQGENPREVVKLMGVRQRYEETEIKLTGASVERIRVGYHANRELHLVLDMLDRSSRIRRLHSEGTTLVVLID